MGVYLRPESLDEALAALGRRSATARPPVVLAGGTDYYPARVGRPLDDDILDITAIGDLRGIREDGDAWHVGALTTWTDLLRTPLPHCFDGLKRAAREVGGVQIQNAGTVVGNLCNASPAADGVPPLLTLNAELLLASTDGRRSVPLADFILGNRRTVRRPEELVTGIQVPKPGEGAVSSFLKLGARRYLVISVVMVAVLLEIEDGRVAAARVAVGACSPVAQRLPALEAALAGRPVGPSLAALVAPGLVDPAIAPIDDIRGTGAYRRDAVLHLLRRALAEAGSAAGDGDGRTGGRAA